MLGLLDLRLVFVVFIVRRLMSFVFEWLRLLELWRGTGRYASSV